MSWFALTVCSAVLLGLYDLAKKAALRGAPPMAVLMATVLVGAATWAPCVAAASLGWSAALPSGLRVATSLGWAEHGLLLAKSTLVAASWALAYAALARLPVSIAAPIRSTSPAFTILVAVALMGERPSTTQWLGVATVLAAFYAFSWASAAEGVHFARNKWVGCMGLSTLLAACSALYDKYLFQQTDLDVPTVQAWFSLYLVPVVAPWYLRWRRRCGAPHAELLQPLAVAIAWLLLAADYAYFAALATDGALIAVVSPLRRTAVAVSLVGGVLLFGERGFRRKAACVGAMLAGVTLLAFY